eukprot:NODE_222_length_13951_cov_0.396982.p2 type:complete len:532 gc:universal NODE_222_length_13951_cov_0.396982:10517-12112(+)
MSRQEPHQHERFRYAFQFSQLLLKSWSVSLMDLISKIERGTFTKSEFTSTCNRIRLLHSFDNEHLLVISALSTFNINWFVDFFDEIVENLLPCPNIDYYRCLGYVIQYQELWYLVTMKNPSSTFISKSEKRKQIFDALLKIPIVNHKHCYFFISNLITSTRNVNQDLLSMFYSKIAKIACHLEVKAMLILLARFELSLSEDCLEKIFKSVELEPYLIPFYIMPVILKFQRIPSLGSWTNLLNAVFIQSDESQSIKFYNSLSLILENKLIISSILENCDLLINLKVSLAFELLNMKVAIDKSTIKSTREVSLHPTLQGWRLMTKVVANDRALDSLQINDLYAKIIYTLSERGFSHKLLASNCIAAFSDSLFKSLVALVEVDKLIDLSILICSGNEKYRLGGLRLFYLASEYNIELNNSQTLQFQKVFNKSCLSGPFQLRWNGIIIFNIACMCIERIRPVLKDSLIIEDFTWTLVSALKCRNSKVVVHAMSALRFYPWDDKISANEIKAIAESLAQLSPKYMERLKSIIKDLA